MLKLIKMNKVDILIATIAAGLFISYFFTGFLALPFIGGGMFIGERFINPLIFGKNGE